MRGIRLEFLAKTNNYLWRVFRNVNIDQFTWRISLEEIYTQDDKGEYLDGNTIFEKKILEGKEFTEIINNNYYIFHVTLEAFPNNSSFVKIRDYNDYSNSSCFLFFLCVDREETYVYCKDQDVLTKIKLECNNIDIWYKGDITDENDDIRFY